MKADPSQKEQKGRGQQRLKGSGGEKSSSAQVLPAEKTTSMLFSEAKSATTEGGGSGRGLTRAKTLTRGEPFQTSRPEDPERRLELGFIEGTHDQAAEDEK